MAKAFVVVSKKIVLRVRRTLEIFSSLVPRVCIEKCRGAFAFLVDLDALQNRVADKRILSAGSRLIHSQALSCRESPRRCRRHACESLSRVARRVESAVDGAQPSAQEVIEFASLLFLVASLSPLSPFPLFSPTFLSCHQPYLTTVERYSCARNGPTQLAKGRLR